MALKYKDKYLTYDKREHCKRLINLVGDIRYNRKKIKKLYNKHKTKKMLIMFLSLNKKNYLYFMIVYKFFNIDKRFNVLSIIEELARYRCDNIYFKSNYMKINLTKFYGDLGSSKYTSNHDLLLDNVIHNLLLKRS